MSKEEYKENRKRAKEIYGVDPKDDGYNIHHIIPRAEGGGDEISNLCPLEIDVHDWLHKKINRMENKHH